MLAALDEPGRDDNELFFDKLRAFVVTHETSVNEQVRTMNAERIAPDHWDVNTDVISLDMSFDNIRESIAGVLGTAALHNALFHRTVLVLTAMKVEMKALTEELHSTLLPPLALYGDPQPGADVTREEGVVGLGKIIPLLMDIWNWHERVKQVVRLCVQQFASLYSEAHAQNKFAPYQEVQLPSLWFTFFDLLGSVAAVEEVINQHETLTSSVHTFHRIMENVKRHPDRYDNANVTYIEEFGRMLMKLETDLMQRQMLNAVAGVKCDTPSVNVTGNTAFFNTFLSQLESYMNRETLVRLEGRNPTRIISICAAYTLFDRLFDGQMSRESALQRRLTTNIYALHTVFPVVPVIGPVAFRTAQWLTKRFPMYITQISKDPQKDNLLALQEECKRLQATFETEVRRAKLAVAVWQAQFVSSYSHDRDKTKSLLADMTDLLLRGVAMAYRLRQQATLVLSAFETTGMTLTMGVVQAIHVSIDLLVTIRSTYHTKSRFVASAFPILLENQAFAMAQILYDVYKRLTEELQKGGGSGMRAVQAEALTDQQCAVGQILALLGKPMSKQCIIAIEMCMHIAFHRQSSVINALLGQNVIDEISLSFSLLRGIVDHQRALKEATDCDFLYWQRESLFRIFFKTFLKQPLMAQRMRPLCAALHDSVGLILTARHVKKPERLVAKFESYVRTVIDEELLKPLYSAIENDLLMHAHSTVLNEPYKGISSAADVQLYSRLTGLPPMRLFGKWFSIAQKVENYLEQSFYNLNAITLADGKMYEEIRSLTKSRYNLTLVDSYLPGSIPESGLDVMVVTKSIHMFVANYTYNLNEQLFVQRPSVTDTKFLSTLHIRHVANSIRTHGTGMMNTTVNYVYKCLLKKLSAVSQFLYDDHIRSKLLKDIKFFQEQKHALNGRFPVKRAEKFCAEIRKLGVTEDNRSFLDQFRELVSTIGNALGYMRMVRSGGLRCIAEAAAFIPALDSVPFFEKVIDPNAVREGQDPPEEELDFKPQVSQFTSDSIRVLDKALGNMTKRLSDGSDYFLMLQQAISAKLQDPKKYGHLRHFYMIVPALSMSFVDMMIHQKERLMKKNKEGLFTDDGFALGCVFLLALFNKHASDFDSLHWFESVVHHFQEKRAQTKSDLTERIEQQRRDGDTFASQTIQLTLTMVESSLAEYSALQQSFNSCHVFFQSKRKAEADEENEEDDEEAAAE